MEIVYPERVSVGIDRTGYHEEGLTLMLLKLLAPGMIMFDVGAHFGYFSILASTLVGVSGQVHSFEPTPSTFKTLERNASTRPNIRPNNLALSERDGNLSFRDYGVRYAAFNTLGTGKLEDERLQREQIEAKVYEIPAIRADCYVTNTGASPDLVKIDAEGAELSVLRGMAETIQKFRPAVTLEVGDEGGASSVPPVEWLLQHEYLAFSYHNGTIEPHRVQQDYAYDNLLFLHRSRLDEYVRAGVMPKGR